MHRLRLLPHLLLAATVTLLAPTARADVLPLPTRPAWDQEPPPMPEPPPEKDLERRHIPWVIIGLLGVVAIAAVAQRRRMQPGVARSVRG